MESVQTFAPAASARAARARAVPLDVAVYSVTALYIAACVGAAVVVFLARDFARFDLGNMVQAVWSTAHGHFLENTTGQGQQASRLGSHVDPFLALLVPVWVLF